MLIVVFHVDKREDPKGTSQTSLKFAEEPAKPTIFPPTHRASASRPPPLEPVNRRTASVGDDRAPLLPIQRQARSGDVAAPSSLPQYHRPMDREYPVPSHPRNRPGSSGDIGNYVGASSEHQQALPYVEQPCITAVSMFFAFSTLDTIPGLTITLPFCLPLFAILIIMPFVHLILNCALVLQRDSISTLLCFASLSIVYVCLDLRGMTNTESINFLFCFRRPATQQQSEHNLTRVRLQ